MALVLWTNQGPVLYCSLRQISYGLEKDQLDVSIVTLDQSEASITWTVAAEAGGPPSRWPRGPAPCRRRSGLQICLP